MKPLHGFLALAIVLAAGAPSHAQLIFSKKPKAKPSQRVPELILIVKTDSDEKKRAHAAEELRDYDSVTFGEIVPVLVDVLKNEKKQSVRLEAVNSLAKIRPVTTLAGHALEKAAADDENWRVRWQAKAALPKYHLAGYSSKKTDPKGKSTGEPPLADPTTPLPLLRFDSLEPPRVAPAAPLPKSVAPKAATSPPTQQGPSLFP
jgi:hypothetical protein